MLVCSLMRYREGVDQDGRRGDRRGGRSRGREIAIKIYYVIKEKPIVGNKEEKKIIC